MSDLGWRLVSTLAITVAVAACSDPAPSAAAPKPAPAAAPAAAAPATPAPAPVASANPEGQAIDAAVWSATPADAAAAKRALIRAQVLLARARFSPGVIDGQMGENVRQAIAAFEQARGLPVDGALDDQVWAALAADAAPAMQDYTIAPEDVAGPFVAKIPTDPAEMAKLDKLAYSSPVELLAEKFHMDEGLLKALNPNADFTKAGATILVANPGDGALPAKVARVEVDKSEREVRAYGADDALLAVYPATVGSTDRPAPSGEWAVNVVAPDPTWTYDPSRLTFGKKADGKQTIAAGPNNPVGAVWIDLTKDTYGIHGTPDPAKVGKAESHGCVRLTNWDAVALSKAVEKGTKVVFVGSEKKA